MCLQKNNQTASSSTEFATETKTSSAEIYGEKLQSETGSWSFQVERLPKEKCQFGMYIKNFCNVSLSDIYKSNGQYFFGFFFLQRHGYCVR